ncbi:serine hydrolase domain-containing protein [Cyclobacterium xiamenense]|uniref:serine hydrolase domain-containing protein n=1 Tax=Cyclobacterium xiamenense TaxID=1297121 RepID=UPI0035D0D859
MRRVIGIILLSIGFVASGFSQSKNESEISKAVESYISQNGFSGTILVANEGQPIFHESYGFAYYSTPDTLRKEDCFSIASITKLFTSIRILQLQEEGKLSLENTINTYLPEYQEYVSNDVSIHHLLLHISGLPEERGKMYQRRFKPEAWVKKVLAHRTKSRWGVFNYNNIDYVLLGLIIERLTGNSWEKEISDAILTPLKMSQTGFLEYGYYPQNFAYTFSNGRSGLKQDPLWFIENFYAAGSMYSTASDLLKLDQALYGEALLSESSKRLLSKSYPEYGYAGYGVWNYDYPFVAARPTIMERRGKIRGANVVLVRLTGEKYTLIILSNDDRFNPDSYGDPENLREKLIHVLYK